MPVKIVQPLVSPIEGDKEFFYPEGTVELVKDAVLTKDAKKTYALTDKALTELEYQTYQNEFASRALHKTKGRLVEQIDHRYVPWSAIAEAADAVVPNACGGKGVMIHFAIDGDELRYGFTFFPWTEKVGNEWRYAPIGYPTHVLDNKQLLPAKDYPWDAWQANYYQSIQIDHGQGAMDLDDLLDPHAVVMPYEEEVLALYEQNLVELAGVDDPHVRITSLSCVHPGPGETGHDGGRKGYRHGISLNMARKSGSTWYNLIKSGDNISLYHLRAADYGNLCPTRCSFYLHSV